MKNLSEGEVMKRVPMTVKLDETDHRDFKILLASQGETIQDYLESHIRQIIKLNKEVRRYGRKVIGKS